MTVQSISGVVVFEADTAPKRIAGRYFEANGRLSTREGQIIFEKDLVSKAVKSSAVLAAAGVGSVAPSLTSDKGKDGSGSGSTTTGTENNEIVIIDNYIVILRLTGDVLIAVIARDSQNDLLVAEYTNTIHNCLVEICGGTRISKKKCFDRLDQVFLIIDESIENGVVFEYDAHAIVTRINMTSDGSSVVADGSVGGSGGAVGNGTPPVNASAAVRQGIAALRSGDTESLRSVFAGAAQSFSSFLGR